MKISHKEVPERVSRWLRDLYADYGSRMFDSRQTLQIGFLENDKEEIIGTFTMTFERVNDQKINPSLHHMRPRAIGVKQKDRMIAAKKRGDI